MGASQFEAIDHQGHSPAAVRPEKQSSLRTAQSLAMRKIPGQAKKVRTAGQGYNHRITES